MNLFPLTKPVSDRDIRRAISDIIDRIQMLQISQSQTLEIRQTTNGTTLEVKNPTGGGNNEARWG